MADHGQRAAEEAQAKVARRLKSIYGEAVKDIDKQLKAYTDKYAKADVKMRAKLAAGKITDAQYAAWKRGQVFTGDLWHKKRDMLAGTMYDADVLAQRIINGERLNVFAENMNSMAYDMEHGEGVDMGFGYYDSSTVARLLAEDPEMLPAPKVKKDKDTTWYRSKVNNVVTKGIIMGSSIPDMASEIARETGEMAYKAALRNARTAMTGAQNAGRIEAMEQAQSMGIKVQKRWMSTLDGRTRDAHRDLDGQVQDVDKPFNSDLGDIMFPGDPHAHPGNVYNCRCTLVYVHPEYPSDLPRRDQTTGEVIEDMSYREWESWKQGGGTAIGAAQKSTRHVTAQGRDIATSWQRRPDKFDFEINDVIDAQGFDGNPRVVDADELDIAVKQSSFIAQRTYSAPNQETLDAYREQLYSGKWYVDCSTGGAQYGQGMYCAADYTGTLSDGIKNEMEHYRDLSESRYGDAQREYAEKVYQEEIDKVNFPLDDKYKNAFTDEMGITDMWTRGSEERKFIKDWISKNPEEAKKLKGAYEKAQEIGAKKGMEIESLTREQFKEKYPNIGARSYTETLTLAQDAKIVTWREINDIRTGTLSIEYRNEILEKELKRRGLVGDELTFARYNAGLGGTWDEVDSAARRLGADKRNAVMEQLEDAGKVTQKLFDEEQARRKERAHMYQEKYHDIGSLAAALGYDAINAENHGQSGSYTVILNRTKVIFRRPK